MSTRRAFLTALAAPLAANAAPPRSQMGIASTCYMTVRRPRDAFQFLEYCHSLGAGGIQISLNNQAPDYLRKLRTQAEKHGMYIEVMAGLPRSEHDESFQRTLQAAKEVGALCVRSACLGGRRYETFASIGEWETFTANSHAAIRRAVPIADKIKMPWAIENHKDWTVDEFVAVMKQYSSEYFGCCLDTGNNLSLLDDAMEVVERLAPYAISSHLKDMAAEEYSEGFLLAEVPFGEGMLDIARMTKTIRNARPTTKITLEMITRDPLKVPVLTEKYWATFPDRGARRLAATLKMIRGARHTKPIPLLTALPANAQLQLEEDNVKSCLNYARERLAL